MPGLTPVDIIGIVFGAIYGITMVGLATYGLHGMWLLLRFSRVRHAAHKLEEEELARPLPPDHELPKVVVQLPVFNERECVQRMVDAAGKLDWPHDRLEIQLLDDSTDDTTEQGERCVAQLRAQGINAIMLHRVDRTGFKAGALDEGLKVTDAAFVAIFDADFIPAPDFIKRAIKPLLADEGLGLVQGRWEHLNRHDSILTEAQAIGIDGHFGIEQGARAWSGLAMNFNGTCGLWRIKAIEDGGGWEHETLTEDLDLSYRVQMAGWRCTYRMGLAVPGEVPADINAWMNQQFRWAKGSQQCTRKLLGRIWRSTWPFHNKLAATLHLSHYAVHPLMLLSLIVAPIAFWLCPAPHPCFIVLGAIAFAIGILSPIATYVTSQGVLGDGRSRWALLIRLPTLSALGTGIAICISRAVFEAWAGVISPFVRTPKAGESTSATGSYKPSGCTGVPELLCGLWAFIGIGLSFHRERPWATPLLMIFASGFLSVGVMCLKRWWQRQPRLAFRAGPAIGLGLLGAVSLAAYSWMVTGTAGSWQTDPVAFAGLGLVIGACYLAAIPLLRHGSRQLTLIVILFAIAFRLVCLGLPATDELNRSVIEGRQAAHWQSPYMVPPTSAAARWAVRDEQIPADTFTGVQDPTSTAISLPVTIGFEMLVTRINTRISTMRLAAVILESLTWVLMLAILSKRKMAGALVALVAWNPIGPLWLVGEGHGIVLMLFLLTASFWLHQHKAHRSAIATVTLAALAQPLAIAALVPLLLRRRWTQWLIPVAIGGLAYLPFANAGINLFGGLEHLGIGPQFRGALEPLLRDAYGVLVPDISITTLHLVVTLSLLGIFLIGATVVIQRYLRGISRFGRNDPLVLGGKLMILLLLCLPTLHVWYLAGAMLFIPFLPLRGLLLWTASAALYFLHGLEMMNSGMLSETVWVTHLAHLPAVLLLGWEILRRYQPVALEMPDWDVAIAAPVTVNE